MLSLSSLWETPWRWLCSRALLWPQVVCVCLCVSKGARVASTSQIHLWHGFLFTSWGWKAKVAQLLNFPTTVCVSRKEFITYSMCACKWCVSELSADFHMTVFVIEIIPHDRQRPVAFEEQLFIYMYFWDKNKICKYSPILEGNTFLA